MCTENNVVLKPGFYYVCACAYVCEESASIAFAWESPVKFEHDQATLMIALTALRREGNGTKRRCWRGGWRGAAISRANADLDL